MATQRSSILSQLMIVLGITLSALPAIAQTYPTRPLRVIVPFAPGRTGSRRMGWCWGGDGARPPGFVRMLASCVAKIMCACAVAVAMPVIAQTYPTRPIRVIVPFAPGGGSDVIARLIGPRLAEALGQSVVVDNRPAASGVVGTELVANAAPDGHTLLLVTATHAVTAQLAARLPYDIIRDFTPITEVIASPFGMMLHPSVPASTVREVIAYAKANPGKLNYGSSGPGSSPHLATELLMSMAGIQMVHVPYKGVAQYVTAQLGNEIQFSFGNMFSTMGHWKAGRLRLVAHAGSRRLAAFPELPTVAESGVPGYEASLWYGYLAPARTPRRIIERLHAAIVTIARASDIQQMLTSQGNDTILNTPEEFAQVIKREADKWGAIGKRLGVRLD